MKKTIQKAMSSLTAKLAALLLAALGCAGSAWGATTQVATQTELAAAVANAAAGDIVQITAAGTYTLGGFSDKTLTIQAADGVTARFAISGEVNLSGCNMTFKNVVFDYANQNYIGITHVNTVTYDSCTLNGQVTLYGNEETFNGCTFSQTSSDWYNLWTYGADKVVFNGCTFNSAGKSVLVYSEDPAQFNDVSVIQCVFNASATVEGKAAIEIDTSLTAGATIAVDAATTVSETFGDGNVSASKVYNNKRGNAGANNDITVVIGDTTVLEPTYAAQIGATKYATFAAAVEAVPTDGTMTTITMLADEIISGNEGVTIVANKNVVLDLAGRTIELVVANANSAAYLIRNNGTLTVNDSATGGSLYVNAEGVSAQALPPSRKARP